MNIQSALLFFLVPIFLNVTAQSGYLDTTFGNQGIVLKDLGLSNEFVSDAIIQADGKIIIVGTGGTTNSDFAILRYLADGTIDQGFGEEGIVEIDFNGVDDLAHAVTLQDDGKIVVAGQAALLDSLDFAVVRLLNDGSLDNTFSINGKATFHLATGFEYANDVAVQQDGKILLAGRTASTTFTDFAMIRLHPDGTLDSDFGSNGIVVTSFRDEDEAVDIVLQPDGKIILGGYSSVLAQGDFALARYNYEGTLDKDFGVGGKVRTDVQGGSDVSNGLALLPDGSIIAGGIVNYFNLAQTADIGMVKYLNDGSLDLSFGSGGKVILDAGEINDIRSIALQPDGKPLLAGKTDHPDGENKWFLARFLPDGSLDSIFGTNGITTTVFPGNNEFAYKVLIAKDSRIIVAGGARPINLYDFAIARYIADFIIDVTVLDNICYNENDGGLLVNVSGGIPPFEYSLDGIIFQTENFFDGLPAGTYNIVVRDSRGVFATYGPEEIQEAPIPPVITVEVIESQISIAVDGSTQGFLFSIDGSSFSTQQVYQNLPDGTYNIEVLDNNGCLIYSAVVIVSTTSLVPLHNKSDLSIYPNPGNGIFLVGYEKYLSRATVSVFDFTGRLVYHSIAEPDGNEHIRLDLSFLAPGIYQMLMQDEGWWGIEKVGVFR